MLPADVIATATQPRIRIAALVILGATAGVVYALDQISKQLVIDNLPFGTTVPFLGQLLQLHFVTNSGAAFSLGSGSTWIFVIIASAVSIFIVVFARRIRSTAWAVLFGMLLGGTLGNLTDRLMREPGFGRGHVIDFLQLYGFPAIFNLADVAIVCSMGLFILLTLAGRGLDGKRVERQPSSASDTPNDQS